MKITFNILFLFFITCSVYADTFTVGDRELVVPSPQGFSCVTPQMDKVYRLSLQVIDPMNDQLAYYISETDIPSAIEGELPPLEYTFILKVNKKLKNIIVGSADFAELKRMTKNQNKEIYESIKSEMPDYLDKMNKGIGQEFDMDFALRLSKFVPLDPHYETDNALAYSMYINYGVISEGIQKSVIVSATCTFVNLSGKVLFLYCYGPRDQLEWTRNASRAWTERIIVDNVQPPKRSLGSRGINWYVVMEKSIVGAITGGLIALIIVGFSILKKRKKSR